MSLFEWSSLDYTFRHEGDSLLRDLTPDERARFRGTAGVARVDFWAEVNPAGVDVLEAAVFVGCGCLKERFKVVPGMCRLEATLNTIFDEPRRIIVQLKRFGPGGKSWCRAGVSAVSFESVAEGHAVQGAFPVHYDYDSPSRKRGATELADNCLDNSSDNETRAGDEVEENEGNPIKRKPDKSTSGFSLLERDFILSRLLRMLEIKDVSKLTQICRGVRYAMCSSSVWEKAYEMTFNPELLSYDMPAWLSFWTDAVLVRGVQPPEGAIEEVVLADPGGGGSTRDCPAQVRVIVSLSALPPAAVDCLVLDTAVSVRGNRSAACTLNFEKDDCYISLFHPRLSADAWLEHRRQLLLHSAPKGDISLSVAAGWITPPRYSFSWIKFLR